MPEDGFDLRSEDQQVVWRLRVEQRQHADVAPGQEELPQPVVECAGELAPSCTIVFADCRKFSG